MPLYTDGKEVAVIVSNRRAASAIGFYMTSVKQFLATGDHGYLAMFVGKTVTDIEGKKYVFETDPNTLYRLDFAGTDPFELVYRIVL